MMTLKIRSESSGRVKEGKGYFLHLLVMRLCVCECAANKIINFGVGRSCSRNALTAESKIPRYTCNSSPGEGRLMTEGFTRIFLISWITHSQSSSH